MEYVTKNHLDFPLMYYFIFKIKELVSSIELKTQRFSPEGFYKDARILIACEESGIVTKAFREKGFNNVWSCDLLPTNGGHPEWHIQGDVTPLLNQEWDMIIAFPPCTHLAVSGAAWFEQKRKDGRQQQGIDFLCYSLMSQVKYASGRSMPKWYADAFKLPPKERAALRSKTFLDIAKAMASQWGISKGENKCQE